MTATAPEILPLRRLLLDSERFQVLAADLDLVRTLCEADPQWRLEFAYGLAVHEQNQEIGTHVTDSLLPVIADEDLSEEDRNLWFGELKAWLVMQARASIDDGRPAGTPRSVWEDRCQAGVDEAMHELTGGQR